MLLKVHLNFYIFSVRKKVREGCVGVSEMNEKGKKGKTSEKEPKDREPLTMVLVGINFRANYPNLEDLHL